MAEEMTEADHVPVNSEEVSDIMSKMPPWLVQRGIGILLGIVVLMIGGSVFIHYPDVISTQVSIYSGNLPVKFVAKTSGKILYVFNKNGDYVHKGDVICLIENPTVYEHVLRLDTLLGELDVRLTSGADLPDISARDHLQLGEMQATYSDLVQELNQYLFFRRNKFASRKINELRAQIYYQHQLNEELGRKDSLLRLQLLLGENKYTADSSLAKDKVIAPLEFDNSRNELISRQLTVDATHSSIIQNNLQQTEYQKSITQLEQESLQQDDDYREKIGQYIKRLRGEYAVWAEKYMIRSTLDGKLVFFRIWKANQYISAGEGILMVVPPILDYVAKANLPIQGAGKVRIGQRVYIKLAAFPYQEFGVIKGTVSQVSMVPLDTSYAMEIALDNGLRTNINKVIPPQSQISGLAEVQTNNRSIFQRLFETVWIAHRK